MSINKYIFIITFLFCSSALFSQSLNVKVLDSVSLNPIPFASIYFSSNKGIISDENGEFELILQELKKEDSLYISSLGFKKLSFSLKKFNDTIVFLTPKPIELENVILTNKKLSSDEILKRVIENLDKNYENRVTENKIYISRKTKSETEKFNITKFKSSIKEINRELLDSIRDNLSKENNSGLETLCYYYENHNQELDKDSIAQKIKLVKARETYNKGDELLQTLNERLEESLKNNLKSDSYFKIRSGIFGGDLDVDGLEEVDSTDLESIKKFQKKELNRKENFAKNVRNYIKGFYSDLIFREKSNLNFILKSSKYNFSEPKLNYVGEQLVYILECKPKGRSKFAGKLYVNADDYAVIRVDFKNVRPLFKLKLLGVSINQYLSEGKILLSKFNNNKYNLSYYQLRFAQRFGIDRSIKLIEKNKNVKGRRKQNEISFRMDLAAKNEFNVEIQVFESNTIDLKKFRNIKEDNKVLPEYIEAFNTNFWEEFE
ncbi:MAG: carboxypeptidase-like regulatory domain-containing protein [Flavobacteriaceae bacterium]